MRPAARAPRPPPARPGCRGRAGPAPPAARPARHPATSGVPGAGGAHDDAVRRVPLRRSSLLSPAAPALSASIRQHRAAAEGERGVRRSTCGGVSPGAGCLLVTRSAGTGSRSKVSRTVAVASSAASRSRSARTDGPSAASPAARRSRHRRPWPPRGQRRSGPTRTRTAISVQPPALAVWLRRAAWAWAARRPGPGQPGSRRWPAAAARSGPVPGGRRPSAPAPGRCAASTRTPWSGSRWPAPPGPRRRCRSRRPGRRAPRRGQAVQPGSGQGVEQLARHDSAGLGGQRGGKQHLVRDALRDLDDIHGASLPRRRSPARFRGNSTPPTPARPSGVRPIEESARGNQRGP